MQELIVPVQGTYRGESRGRGLVCRLGEAVYYPPGFPHRCGDGSDADAVFYALLQWRRPPSRLNHPCVVTDRRSRLLLLVRWLFDLLPDGAEGDNRNQHLLNLLTDELAASCEVGVVTPSGDVVEHAMRYLEGDLHRAVTLQEVADAVGCSISHLRRLFRARTGRTPGRYLQDLRLDKALNLLLTTRLPLATVAQLCGFASRAHLHRLVRRATGRTPREITKGG